jgi:glycosyltransferase involved in cell wall biosynthesis
LESWNNACDYFISASHYESTGYALCEALACGCVPIATNIPSFQKLSNNGACAILFQPGNEDDLYNKLRQLTTLDYEAVRQRAITFFEKDLSFSAVSRKFAQIVYKVTL